jgi:hypothetical protein
VNFSNFLSYGESSNSPQFSSKDRFPNFRRRARNYGDITLEFGLDHPHRIFSSREREREQKVLYGNHWGATSRSYSSKFGLNRLIKLRNYDEEAKLFAIPLKPPRRSRSSPPWAKPLPPTTASRHPPGAACRRRRRRRRIKHLSESSSGSQAPSSRLLKSQSREQKRIIHQCFPKLIE